MRRRLQSRVYQTSIGVVVALVAASAAVTIQSNSAVASASSRYQIAKAQLDSTLAQARAAGFTDAELAPFVAHEESIVDAQPPILPELKSAFYNAQADQLATLEYGLQSEEQTLLDDAEASASSTLQLDSDLLVRDDRLGIDPAQLAPLQTQVATLLSFEKSARTPTQLLSLAQRAQSIERQARALAQQLAAANAALAKDAQRLDAAAGGNVYVLRHDASGPLFKGRNDATIASYMGMAAVTGEDQALEHYAALLNSHQSAQVALGAVGVMRYAQLIHQTLIGHLPAQTIIVSLQAQELWAYDHGRLVLDSLVTTGAPDLPTDVGQMHVLVKASPWTMHSPWPPGSPHWYPDTVVQMAIFFTDTGEALHDASWEPDGYYGPGSQYSGVASHGCIHVPFRNERWLYGWVQLGTPVVVFPGDGTPVKAQMAKITVDASGEPTTGPKGV